MATQTPFKLYEPATAKVNFYCAGCENLVNVGESCTNVIHPVENDDEYPVVTTICDDCLYAEAN